MRWRRCRPLDWPRGRCGGFNADYRTGADRYKQPDWPHGRCEVDKIGAYARRELVFFALGTMDVCVIAPLVGALLAAIVPLQPWPVAAALLGAVLAVHYLARLSLWLPLRPTFRFGSLGVGMLVSGLVVVHQVLHAQTPLLNPRWLADILSNFQEESLSRAVFIFLFVVFLWWRGLVLAQRRLDSRSVAFRFRLGLILIAVTTTVSGSVLSWPYHRFVFAFFFASLLGIALARAEEVGQQYGGSQSPFGLGWLATLVAAGLAVLLLAGGLALLLTGENIGLALVPILQVLRIVLFGLVYVVAWIAQIVIAPLVALFQQHELGRVFEQLSRRMTPPEASEVEKQTQALPLTAAQLARLRLVGIIGGVLLVLVLVVLSLRRMRSQARWQRGEERESVWEGAHLRRGLRDLLRRGRQRLDDAAAALRRSRLGRFFAAMTIRRIYAYMGALAAEGGYPRALHETPYEYLPALEQAFPGNHEEIVRITEAYVAVHYGEVPEQPEELALIQAAWENIHQSNTRAQPM